MLRISTVIVFISNLFLLFDTISAQTLPTNNLNLPSQCYSYSVIQDESRNVNAVGSNACDTMFLSGPTWVRFVGTSATELATSPTSSNQCGTQVTGWYTGLMPGIAQTVNNGRVCFSWTTNNCQWSNTISVTNCGSFYVYQLTVPPICSARYCTATSNIPTTTIVNRLAQCTNYTTIDEPTRNVNQGKGDNADSTYFNGSARWVRFQGVGGTEIPTSPVAMYKCGTNAPGWYSGVMPTTQDTTTSGNVCYTWSSGNCAYQNNIKVTNCGSYYVYYLSSPSTGGMRYCTTNSTINN